ncbi:MAG: glycosyltransferase [Bacteroidetes bacterium]|nr:glycosyltransferase [Bacteroidota bacterium]MBS1649267.1 glycosyltransferase [Bacteroidota bacterium]
MKKKTIFIVCTGLGNINRGYETFTRECFDVLKNSDEFNLILLKGAGNTTNNEIVINNCKRNSTTTLLISKIFKCETYKIEQISFALNMLPKIFKYKPSLIYYSDFILGTWLWHFRKWLKFKYTLLFSNGAPNGPPFTRTDFVQQLLPLYVEQSMKAGEPKEKFIVLPYAIYCNKEENIESSKQIVELRKSLNIPLDKKIIISVGAINSNHKRMNYVIDEFAVMNNDKYFLILLGQLNAESEEIITKASKQLKTGTYLIKQVDSNWVKLYLLMSDYFILASLNEGLPRVLPEALSCGLLPIVHDYNVTRETLKGKGIFKNLTQSRQLSNAINEVDECKISKEDLIKFAFENYSWNVLKYNYQSILSQYA